ncbi:MAG: dinitrogenase iron-molybdenum cofactor [Clostridiales bacterium]|nr:dinitrogenase iron-molybdenum cofactor [Clostridiales bacterium]
MKIAVAREGEFVSGHFGHSEGFVVYNVDEKQVVKKDFIENPGHRPGFLPDLLEDLGVDVVIAGGMGATAQQLFAKKNIDVIVGAEGNCDDVIQKYLNNDLKSTGSICREHKHQHECHCH